MTRKARAWAMEIELDKAGQSILRLLHKAAGVAEENSRHAVDMAQKLSTSYARPSTALLSSRLRPTRWTGPGGNHSSVYTRK